MTSRYRCLTSRNQLPDDCAVCTVGLARLNADRAAAYEPAAQMSMVL